jgi:hypothetical protein
MIPNVNFNPSFANLAALHGLGGGMPHPIRVGAPIQSGIPPAIPPSSPTMWGGQPPTGGLMTGATPGMPGQMPGMPGPAQQGNLGNLQALMQLLGQRGAMQQ